jgi:hypothetical protein
MAQGADEEGSDVDSVTGLTWRLIAMEREIEEEPLSETDGEPINEEDIDFESDQDVVITTGYELEGEEDNDG